MFCCSALFCFCIAKQFAPFFMVLFGVWIIRGHCGNVPGCEQMPLASCFRKRPRAYVFFPSLATIYFYLTSPIFSISPPLTHTQKKISCNDECCAAFGRSNKCSVRGSFLADRSSCVRAQSPRSSFAVYRIHHEQSMGNVIHRRPPFP